MAGPWVCACRLYRELCVDEVWRGLITDIERARSDLVGQSFDMFTRFSGSRPGVSGRIDRVRSQLITTGVSTSNTQLSSDVTIKPPEVLTLPDQAHAGAIRLDLVAMAKLVELTRGGLFPKDTCSQARRVPTNAPQSVSGVTLVITFAWGTSGSVARNAHSPRRAGDAHTTIRGLILSSNPD